MLAVSSTKFSPITKFPREQSAIASFVLSKLLTTEKPTAPVISCDKVWIDDIINMIA